MKRWTDPAVRSALGLGPEASAAGVAYNEVGTDTRTLGPGALFVALRGERFDAHDFLGDAAARGARGAVVERLPQNAPEGLVYYRVADTLTALGLLARYRRRNLAARVCAVTGTNGKTATKDMARVVLATRYRTHATTGNLNNLVGTPLTILSAPPDVEALIVEVGTNAPGEIARLAGIVEPDAAIITSVAQGHLEGLGDLEGVLREKTSLLSVLPEDGLALVADEPPELARRARTLTRRVQVAGWSERADAEVRGEDVRLDPEGRVRFRWAGRVVRLAFRGRPHARNALLALGLGRAWGVRPDAAVAALAKLEPAKLRTEARYYGRLRVIADCYNSNPESLAAAVELLVSLPRGGGRVLVLGTMRELGAHSAELHRRAAEAIAAQDLDLIVATGEFVPAFDALAERLGDRLMREDDPLAAYGPLSRRLRGDEIVLLKGSRGVALERLLPKFEERFGPAVVSRPARARRGNGRRR
ncbi:MAG: UDP-N-acetylmuramoyl-tripeptide--D-alanyl-D-alanine ligase [Gemmatimonadetes bacterium]|nr:UDP-N-acetylmuramoyl-tripeptide--D-alanyl-D-alanine ligase [Gemmatimonadota bacterium]